MLWIVLGVVLLAVIAISQTALRPYSFGSRDPYLRRNSVTLDEIPSIFDALKSQAIDASFAVFLPEQTAADGDVLNLQISFENGRLGLDWVLLSNVNVRDKTRFTELLDAENVIHREVNAGHCKYIRTEDVRAPELCQMVLDKLYGISPSDPIDFMIDGFQWPQ